MWDVNSDRFHHWEFYAIQHETNCLEELSELLDKKATRKHAEQLIKTINELSLHEQGPKIFINNPNICHEAVAGEAIYSLRKGDIRLYWFYGENRRVVICPMVFVKKEQKTPKAIAKKLKEFKSSYLEAYKNQHITYKT